MEQRKKRHTRRQPRAVTKDVVGVAPRRPRIRSEWRQHYDRLLELRQALVEGQADLAQDALQEQPAFSMHIADAGTDTFDRDFALGLLSSERDALYEIEQALRRIQEGTYGRCEATGKPIQAARLRAIPWTRYSADAEKQLEQQGALRGPHIGARQAVTRSSATKPPEEG